MQNKIRNYCFWGIGYFIFGIFYTVICAVMLLSGSWLLIALVPVWSLLMTAVSIAYFTTKNLVLRIILILMLLIPLVVAILLQIGLLEGWYYIGWLEY